MRTLYFVNSNYETLDPHLVLNVMSCKSDQLLYPLFTHGNCGFTLFEIETDSDIPESSCLNLPLCKVGDYTLVSQSSFLEESTWDGFNLNGVFASWLPFRMNDEELLQMYLRKGYNPPKNIEEYLQIVKRKKGLFRKLLRQAKPMLNTSL